MADQPSKHPITVYDPNLAHSLKRGCPKCDGDAFAVEDVTGNAGAGEGLYFQCIGCGYTELRTFAQMGATQNYS